MSNVSNNDFINNRWRINRDGICAKKELQNSSIDEVMLVESKVEEVVSAG